MTKAQTSKTTPSAIDKIEDVQVTLEPPTEDSIDYSKIYGTPKLPSEAIATINAYQSGILNVTILHHRRQSMLTGQLGIFTVQSTIGEQKVLARINNVDMTNQIHTSVNSQNFIAQMGRMNYFSGDCDVLTGNVGILGCKNPLTGFGSLACPPRSGTLIKEATGADMIDFQVDEAQGVIGHIPDRPNLLMSIVSRHFGEYEEGGHGEAKHTAIFGQNGSGKTILGLGVSALQLAQNPQMGALIPDTAGDLTRVDGHRKGDFQFNFHELMTKAGRRVEMFEIASIRLNSPTTYQQLLKPFLKDALNTSLPKAEVVAEHLTTDLFGDKEVDIGVASADTILEMLPEAVAASYAKNSRKSKKEELEEMLAKPNRIATFNRRYASMVKQFFEGEFSLKDIIWRSMCQGEIVMIRMNTMSESDQAMVMNDVFYQLKKTAQDRFRATHETFNGLVVLDEGPRWVPQSRNSGGDDPTASTIIDAFNTTRKLGIGWTIISQRPSAISKDVIAQCHTKFAGKGLGIGVDRGHLETFFGHDGLINYDQLALRGGYFWMGTGDLINYGQGTQFFAFDTFGGNATQAMVDANPHIWID